MMCHRALSFAQTPMPIPMPMQCHLRAIPIPMPMQFQCQYQCNLISGLCRQSSSEQQKWRRPPWTQNGTRNSDCKPFYKSLLTRWNFCISVENNDFWGTPQLADIFQSKWLLNLQWHRRSGARLPSSWHLVGFFERNFLITAQVARFLTRAKLRQFLLRDPNFYELPKILNFEGTQIFMNCQKFKLWRDHDDETNVLEAVRKLNDVKGVKGIRRYFKQVPMIPIKIEDIKLDDDDDT